MTVEELDELYLKLDKLDRDEDQLTMRAIELEWTRRHEANLDGLGHPVGE
jgi:hypothetical protein